MKFFHGGEPRARLRAVALVAALGISALPACSGNDNARNHPGSGGSGGSSGAGGAGTGGTGGLAGAGGSGGQGVSLKPFTKVPDPGAGAIWFAASGEVLALTGYPFPPANAGDPAFVDGWDLKFSHLLVTVDKVKISENPDTVPGDESKTGKLVGEVDGPWAIDLSYSDPGYLPGKGGAGEEAVPFAALKNQNKNGGAAFKTDGSRYAFGFDDVAATSNAMNVNLDQEALADYQQMIDQQCVVLYDGTATFKGDASCNSDAEYADWPSTVHFMLCFKSPTSYINCQNPDNDPAAPLGNEEHQRGIAPSATTSSVAQVTFHTDHPFWDSVLHDSPAHFDQFAAQLAGSTDANPTVTLAMVQGKDYTAMTDAHGNALTWRYCMAPPTDVHAQFAGAMAFDPQSVPHATGNDPSTGLRDYDDFTTYNQSTQGHLNSDGLCFVKRNYPSPQ